MWVFMHITRVCLLYAPAVHKESAVYLYIKLCIFVIVECENYNLLLTVLHTFIKLPK